MNILLLISSLSYGGAEKQAVIDANMLCAHHAVYLATFRSGPQAEQLSDKVEHIIFAKGNYITAARRVAAFVKEKKIDVIHASLFAPMTVAALASLLVKVNVVWHFHSHEYDIPFRSKFIFKILSGLPTVKKILFVNHELMQHFGSCFKFPSKKLDVLYNSTEMIDATESVEKNSKTINIGYVGRFVELKRVEYLIELGEFLHKQNVRDWEIHLVGDGTEREKLEQLAKKKKLADRIKFHGFQSNTRPYYQSFDLFINPSREECLSIALIDAGTNGLASIAFNVGGNDEIIQNSKSGFIVATKEEMFEKALELIRDADLREKFGKQAKNYCLKLFSPKTHLSELEKIYNQCIVQK